MSNDTKPAEIPALGEGYSHARKAYGLTSALLMAWELIGVELQASPVENLKLTLKSPQAAPYVLIVLILYFGFRVTIEWYQTDIRRRQLRASRVDFAASHIIAIAALLLYAFQTLSKIQVANTVAPTGVSSFLGAFMFGLVVCIVIADRRRLREWKKDKLNAFVLLQMILGSLGALAWGLLSAWRVLDLRLVTICAAGLFCGLLFFLFTKWMFRRNPFFFDKD